MELQTKPNGSMVADEDPGEPTTGKPRVSVTEQEAKLLAHLVREATVLEIGTGLGVSTKAMAQTAALVTTYDIDEWVHQNVFPTLKGVRTVADLYPIATDKFDVVFIDGAHDQESVMRDIELAQGFVKKDGLIVLHDHKLSGVQKALFQKGITPLVINTTHEIALVLA